MAPPLLTLRNISLTFGGQPLLEDVELQVAAGARLCLVGRNGSGKSTLMKIAAGLIEADRGERFVQPGKTVRYLEQEPDFAGFDTVADYVQAGLAPGDDPYRAQQLWLELGLTGDEDPTTLSGGEGRRAALARALAPDPDILFLDEPTNHLDLPTIEWLETTLQSMRSALILISHDRRFLTNLSKSVIWLDRGEARRLDQGFDRFEAWRDEVLEQEQLDQHKLERKIHREAHWLRYGVSARRKRNQRRLKNLHELRRQRRDHVGPQGQIKLTQTTAETAAKRVIEAEGLSKAYDGAAPVVTDFSLRVLKGDRIALVGPNGAGKTTLIRLLTGDLAPDGGEITLGANIELVTLDQKRDSLNPDTGLADTLTGGRGDQVMVGGKPKHVIGYMKDFLFRAEQAPTPVGRLSGGERARLMLAVALARPSNLLVLDEPTNDLDLETLDMLEELISDYEGTVLLVSHDRDFIDRVATATVTPETGGRWRAYPGGYEDMLAQRKAGEGEAVAPLSEAKQQAKPAEKKKAAKKPTKLSYKEVRALEQLPGEIAGLQAKAEAIQASIADPSKFDGKMEALNAAIADLAHVTETLQAKEDAWLELEMKREELEG